MTNYVNWKQFNNRSLAFSHPLNTVFIHLPRAGRNLPILISTLQTFPAAHSSLTSNSINHPRVAAWNYPKNGQNVGIRSTATKSWKRDENFFSLLLALCVFASELRGDWTTCRCRRQLLNISLPGLPVLNVYYMDYRYREVFLFPGYYIYTQWNRRGKMSD